MSWRTTAILFVVLLALAAYVYYDSQQVEAPELEPTAVAVERVPLMDGLTLEQVTELTVRASLDETAAETDEATDEVETRQETATFFRDPEGVWTQTVPTSTLVVSATLDSAVNGLLTATSRRSFEPAPNSAGASALEPYGVADPQHLIEVAAMVDAVPTVIRFSVGSQTPAEDAYYVLKEGDARIHLVPPFIIDNIIALVETPPVPTPTPLVGNVLTPTLPLTSTVPVTGTVPITNTVTPAP